MARQWLVKEPETNKLFVTYHSWKSASKNVADPSVYK
jgi:hypothetical protein